jgi:predicted  nucleic acid-binding Zn-ribbon protein
VASSGSAPTRREDRHRDAIFADQGHRVRLASGRLRVGYFADGRRKRIVVTAAPQEQWRLLDLQDHDVRLSQIAHRRKTLPDHAEVERLTTRIRGLESTLVGARTAHADVTRELTKAEVDVDQVRQRAARDQKRLDSGQGSPKDMQALQHEVQSLAQRQAVLEDEQLAVMERLETVDARVAELQGEVDRTQVELAEVTARRDGALATLDAEAEGERNLRAQVAGGIAAELLALYEKVCEQQGGVGAARLHHRRCQGCNMELNPGDLQRIRSSAQDAVLRCEECRRILIRTAESGL